MKFSSISKVAAATILGGAFFVGCGVDDNPVTSSSSDGQALAKYNKSGKVFADCNDNGKYDSAEPTTTTGDTGLFALTIPNSCDYKKIIITDGINSASGKTIPTRSAKKGMTKVSATTTMLASLTDAEETSLLKSLGLTKENLNATDYNNPDAGIDLDVVKKIASLKTFVETVLESTGVASVADLKSVATSLKTAIDANVASGKTLDLSNTALTDSLQASLKAELITNLNSFDSTKYDADVNNVQSEIKEIASAKDLSAISTGLGNAEDKIKNIVVPTKLDLGTTLTVGSTTTTLKEGKFNTTLDTNTSSKVSEFYNIVLNSATLSKDINGTEQVSISVKITDANTTGNNILLSINPVHLKSTNKELSVTIPAGSTVSTVVNGLVTLGVGTTTTTTTDALVNKDLGVNVNSLLGKLSSTNVASKITALDAYLSTANTYDVNLTIGDLNKTKLTTDYTSITGTVIVK